MLKVNDIVSGYDNVNVLHGLSFEVKHEIYAILGANGAGKTTLMKTLARALKLKRGEIYFKDENINGFAPFQVAEKGMAYVPQEENIFPTMSVMENLSVGSVLLDKKLKKQRIEEVFDVFPDLKARLGQKAGSLSGGEAQMVAVGRALMQDPDLILLDEPTAGLSPKYVDLFFNKVSQIHKDKGVGVLISEQNAAKAMAVADKIMVLKLGKIHLIEDSKNVNIDMIKEGYNI